MKIRFKEVHVVAGSRGQLVYMFNDIAEIEEIMQSGWARMAVVFPNGLTTAYIPPDVFELVDEPTERTYTEAEMKAIRTGWEERWNLQQNRLDRAESSKGYWESQAKLEREHRYAQKRKLDLLEPEIKRIEAAVQRVVPEHKEGYLAEHVENMAKEILMTRQARKHGPKLMRDINAIIAEGERKGEAVFISTEDNHPEDQYAEQESALQGSFQEYFEAMGENINKAFERVGSAVKKMKEHNEAQAAGGQVYRDWIVEQAKEYVSSRNSATFGSKVEFFRKDRRVTCVITSTFGYTGATVRFVGRANCAPDDCFNIHIGRAIALMRAEGVQIPAYLLNAPQPDKSRVGDKVNYEGNERTVVLYKDYVPDSGFCVPESLSGRRGKIIDDSREEN